MAVVLSRRVSLTWQRHGPPLQAHQVVRRAQDGQPLGVVLQLERAARLREVDELRPEGSNSYQRIKSQTW